MTSPPGANISEKKFLGALFKRKVRNIYTPRSLAPQVLDASYAPGPSSFFSHA